MMIYTKDNGKIGIYDIVIRAKFDIDIPYYVESNIFTVTILHQCVKNVIYGRPLIDRAYNISQQALIF